MGAAEIRIERQAYWLNAELIVSAPKTKAGTRKLPIPEDLAVLLAAHLDEFAQPGNEGIVFPSNSGRVIDNSIFRQGIWKPAIERAGNPSCRYPRFASDLDNVAPRRWHQREDCKCDAGPQLTSGHHGGLCASSAASQKLAAEKRWAQRWEECWSFPQTLCQSLRSDEEVTA
jgi:hypothetical protein